MCRGKEKSMKVSSNKKESMQEIMKKLEDGVKSVYTSENYITFLKMMAQFHNYSFNNVILILSQCPTASRVASFQTWKRLGCSVKKGEHGIKILVPIPYTYQKKQDSVDDDGNPVQETVDAKGLTFRVGNVFDYQQVSGELPELCTELTDNSEKLQNAILRIVVENDDISFDNSLKEGGANGYFRMDTGEICLRPHMAALQTMKTVIHEKAHSLLHSSDAEAKFTRSEAEVQAESVAYVVCQAFGLDSSDYSFPYIAGWQGKDMDTLRASLSVIEKTAKELMGWLCQHTDLTLEAAV